MGSTDLGEEERSPGPRASISKKPQPWYSGYRLQWVAVFLDAALIFALSSRPRPSDDLPPGSIFEALYDATPGADKIVHFLSFFLFGLLLSIAINATKPADRRFSADRNAVIAFLIATVYAASDETHQVFVPPRTPDIGDFAVDVLGAMVAIVIVRWRVRRTSTRKIPLSP